MSTPPKGEFPHRTYFLVTSLGFIVVVVLMTVVTILGRPEGDGMLLQLAQLADDPGLYRLGFVIATLVPVFTLLLTVGVGLLLRPEQWAASERSDRVAGFIGALFVVAYAPLSAFAYMSQYTIFPDKLDENFQRAERWYISSAESLPLSLDLLAYALFGVGAIVIAARLLWERPPLNWAAVALVASGLTSIVAWLLHVAGVGAAARVSMVGGALAVVFAAGVAFAALRGQRPFPAPDEAAGDGEAAGDDE